MASAVRASGRAVIAYTATLLILLAYVAIYARYLRPPDPLAARWRADRPHHDHETHWGTRR